jgi:endoglucanase
VRVPLAAAGRYLILACAAVRRPRWSRDCEHADRGLSVVAPAGAPPALPAAVTILAPAPAPTTPPAVADDPAAPSAVPVTATNPFAGVNLYVDSDSRAAAQVAAWRSTRPTDAALIAKIADAPQAMWLGDWLTDPQVIVAKRVDAATAADAVALFVAYNIPHRDCAPTGTAPDAYLAWIRSIAAGIADRRAAVVLEPDALPQLSCLDTREQAERLQLLASAVEILAGNRRTAVYLDAGHANWQPAEVMALRLRAAGIERARGFSLNVSNYGTTEAEIAYGTAVSSLTGGKPFVIDTSRNGRGPTADADWCNAPDRAIGARPGTPTEDPLVDAVLWIKNPGESDGPCHGGPPAGDWWPEAALSLAQGATW